MATGAALLLAAASGLIVRITSAAAALPVESMTCTSRVRMRPNLHGVKH